MTDCNIEWVGTDDKTRHERESETGEQANRRRRERALRNIFEGGQFTNDLGLRLVSWDESGTVVVALPHRESLGNGQGAAHGGVIAALMDTAGTAAVWCGHDFTRARGRRNGTVSMSVNYASSARLDDLVAHATCVRRGGSMNFAEIRVEGAEGRLVAHGILAYQISD